MTSFDTTPASAPSSTLALSVGDICDAVETFTGDTTAGAALAYVNSAYRRVLAGVHPADPTCDPHEWSFLRPLTTLVLWPTLSVGTATVTGVYDGVTTITATAASFYASMIGRTLTITDVGDFTVTGYTSSTVITVAGDATCAGKTFSMTADAYGLPSGFAGLESPMVFVSSDATRRRTLEEAGTEQLDILQRDNTSTGVPSLYGLRLRSSDIPSRYDLTVWPEPDAVYTSRIRYRYQPSALADSSALYLPGDAHFSDAVLNAAIVKAGMDKGHVVGSYETAYQEAMIGALQRDKSAYADGGAWYSMSDVEDD